MKQALDDQNYCYGLPSPDVYYPIKYDQQTVWSGLFFIGDDKFFANELRELIEQIHGISFATAKVAHHLKGFCNMGYVLRTRIRNDTAMYIYEVTDKMKKIRGSWIDA